MGKKVNDNTQNRHSDKIESLHDYEDLLENIESVEDLGSDDELARAISGEEEQNTKD